MKTLALLLTLTLHTTGLWHLLPDHSRHHLIQTAATTTTIADPVAAAPAATIALPIRTTTEPAPDLAAGSVLAIDTTSGTILYAKNPAQQRPIASITKLITILVALSRHQPTDTVQIPQLPVYQTADERVGLIPGETYTYGDLVQAALINSGNDAADALALADAGTLPKFAAAMNAKMTEWGITGTRFSNPSGLQDTDNYATALALGNIARLALTNPVIRQTVAQDSATITSSAGRSLNLRTTNQLLAGGQFYGIKTGYTPAAGECFVGLTRIQGHEVITVVLGADDRFGATQTLVNWIDHAWQWL